MRIETGLRENRSLVAKEPFLAPQAAAIAAQRPVRRDHAMARYDERDRVLAVRGSHCPDGLGMPDRLGDGPVGGGPSGRHGPQRGPDLALERSAGALRAYAFERGDVAREVRLERFDDEPGRGAVLEPCLG